MDIAPEQCDLWAMDINLAGEPVAAHRVVGYRYQGSDREVRVTACGRHLNRFTHPTGWWLVPKNELPLAEVKLIHCGIEAVDIPSGDTA